MSIVDILNRASAAARAFTLAAPPMPPVPFVPSPSTPLVPAAPSAQPYPRTLAGDEPFAPTPSVPASTPTSTPAMPAYTPASMTLPTPQTKLNQLVRPQRERSRQSWRGRRAQRASLFGAAATRPLSADIYQLLLGLFLLAIAGVGGYFLFKKK